MMPHEEVLHIGSQILGVLQGPPTLQVLERAGELMADRDRAVGALPGDPIVRGNLDFQKEAETQHMAILARLKQIHDGVCSEMRDFHAQRFQPAPRGMSQPLDVA